LPSLFVAPLTELVSATDQEMEFNVTAGFVGSGGRSVTVAWPNTLLNEGTPQEIRAIGRTAVLNCACQ